MTSTPALDEPLQNFCEGKTVQEIVLLLWSKDINAGTIMSLCKLTEAELAEIVPRSMWLGNKFVKCSKCRGKGHFVIKVPWDQDEAYTAAPTPGEAKVAP